MARQAANPEKKNGGNALYNLHYIATSDECRVFKRIADADYCDIKSIQEIYFFSPGDNGDSYLQNKYLYLFSEGVINFIEANKSAEKYKEVLNNSEIDTVQNYIQTNIDSISSIVSLGPGTSDKEITLIKYFKKHTVNKSLCYTPIDVSINLLQLSMSNFYKEFKDSNRIEIHPIVSDFWKFAEYVRNGNNVPIHCADSSHNTIFTLFGNTFGNYNEKKLLDQIMPLMRKNDVLFVGVDMWSGDKNEEINRIYSENSGSMVSKWLVHPLKHIPFYRGILSNEVFIKFKQEGSMFNIKEPDKNHLTVVNDTICYAPFLKLVKPISKHSEVRNHINIPETIRVASTTKYNLDTLTKWFKDYRYPEGPENTNEKQKFKFKVTPPKNENEKGAVFCLQKQLAGENNGEEGSSMPDLRKNINGH